MSEGMLKNVRARLQRCALLAMCAALTSCASPAQRIDALAAGSQLTRKVVRGTTFQHVVYVREQRDDSSLTVFLEGDGMPWMGGREPATDPTTRKPLALELMLATQGAALYVARPCYQALSDEACGPEAWTFARYGEAIVDSMARVIAREARARQATAVRIVGYSGGGVLAILIAERLEIVDRVITIAANLDVAAWSTHHNYLPLHDSLDPTRSERSHAFREIHLQGAMDRVVPVTTTQRYFQRYPHAQQRSFSDFDHACCWVQAWPQIANELNAAGF